MRLRLVSKFAVTMGITAAVAMTAPAPASAINRTDCGDRMDLLRITENFNKDYCYANKGTKEFGQLTRTFWASKISTGNNDIRWLADNTWHYLPRRHVLDFPTVGTVRLSAVEIL